MGMNSYLLFFNRCYNMLQISRQTIERWKRSRQESQSSDKSQSECGRSDDGDRGADLLATQDACEEGEPQHHAAEELYHSVLDENIVSEAANNVQSTAFDSVSESSDSEVSNSGTSSAQNSSDNGSTYEDSDVVDVDNEGELLDSCYDNPFGDENALYAGCKKTADEAILELLDIYLDNNLSKTALEAILKFYVSSLPPTHNMPPTVHYLFNYVKSMSIPLKEVHHFYCRPQMHVVDSSSGPCDICSSTDIHVFYELPLESQIRFLFQQRGLADLIDGYSEQRAGHGRGNNICDIIDGSQYLRIWHGIENRYKLTLILNTDGIQPHVSSSAKFWPIMFTIMEIPPHLRPSFTIVWGIWFDKELKPDMNLYWKPFVSSLIEIHEAGGISWKHPKTAIVHKSHVLAPLVVADAPARANVLNMQEHQGRYACNTCEQKTNKLPAPPVKPGEKKKRRKRRFLFRESPAQLRTHQRMVTHGTYAAEMGLEHKRGIKGLATIQNIPKIDLSTCVLAEYLHSVLKGAVFQLCSLWFFVRGDWYIGDHLEEINHFLCNDIHPPDFVTRLPKSLAYFSYAKANELRSLLLYYSLIVVAPFLKENYYQHWILFVEAIYILLQESISETDLDAAEAMLRMFVRDIGKLYGDDQYTYNIHQLTHMVLYVRRWGSLSVNSAFSFEGFNHTLANMIHGSKNEGKEILNEISLAQGVQMLRTVVNNEERRVGCSDDIKVLGKALSRNLTLLESQCLSNLNLPNIRLYRRISIGREIYSSKEHDKDMKRRNSYVEFTSNGKKKFGRIVVFCASDETVLCLISVFRVIHSKFFFHKAALVRVKHIIPVEDTNEIVACYVKDVVQKLIQVGNYLCIRPNTIEKNL